MPKITLKAARVNAGLTQKEAAEKLGVSQKTLFLWENLQSVPTIDKVEAISELYGIPYDNILFYVKENA